MLLHDAKRLMTVLGSLGVTSCVRQAPEMTVAHHFFIVDDEDAY
jgi:hypothetical protein